MTEIESSFPAVFISYARENKGVAMQLYEDLKDAGVSPWIDVEDLLPGEDWRLGIRRAIENSTFFLALLSVCSLAKRGFVQKELRLAYEVLDELPNGHIFLIPIRLESCDPTDERIKAAIAERFVLSIKMECLDKMILFGSRSLDRALHEYSVHYLTERPHQALDNELIHRVPSAGDGEVEVHERLGGLLKFYSRAA